MNVENDENKNEQEINETNCECINNKVSDMMRKILKLEMLKLKCENEITKGDSCYIIRHNQPFNIFIGALTIVVPPISFPYYSAFNYITTQRNHLTPNNPQNLLQSPKPANDLNKPAEPTLKQVYITINDDLGFPPQAPVTKKSPPSPTK